jgi:hypothetical protein
MYQKQAEQIQIDYFPLEGGENLVDAAINIAKGQLRFSANYEPADTRGYRRIDGYERFDGQTAPSAAVIAAIPFDAGGTEPVVGTQVFGALTGARGIVIGHTVFSGSWAGGDAAGYIAVTQIAGTFQDDEEIVDTISAFDTGFDSGFQ